MTTWRGYRLSHSQQYMKMKMKMKMKKSSKMGIIQSIVKSSNMAAEGRVPIPSSVPVRVAHEHLLAGHRYLDVRTPEEFRQGHACGAINVPYMNRGMSKNPNFLEQVSSHFKQSDEILVGCQSGGRSFKATADLLDAGFTGVTDVAGGYAAWTQNGLPTQHS